MKFFQRNKKQSVITDSAASKIANGILRIQQWFTWSLSRRTNGWRKKQQWVFLYVICLLFGGLSVLSIVKPFRHDDQSTPIPKAITRPAAINEQGNLLITDEEYQKVQAFINDHPDLLKERPGLFDSLELIRQSYHSQKK